jgi:hypothetical protein
LYYFRIKTTPVPFAMDPPLLEKRRGLLYIGFELNTVLKSFPYFREGGSASTQIDQYIFLLCGDGRVKSPKSKLNRKIIYSLK